MHGIDPTHLGEILQILGHVVPGREVRAFGSRVTGRNLKKWSDLDLAVMGDLPLTINEYGRLKEAFSASDIPFRVDIVDWARASAEFRAAIDEAYEVLQTVPVLREKP